MQTDTLDKVVTGFGGNRYSRPGAGHVILPKAWVGKKVRVEVIE
jgi:hypothetical protein